MPWSGNVSKMGGGMGRVGIDGFAPNQRFDLWRIAPQVGGCRLLFGFWHSERTTQKADCVYPSNSRVSGGSNAGRSRQTGRDCECVLLIVRVFLLLRDSFRLNNFV